jgi:hypothetical protein
MATRSQTTHKKRQRELARMEKQRDKVARRAQRKLEKLNPDGSVVPDDANDESIAASTGEASGGSGSPAGETA